MIRNILFTLFFFIGITFISIIFLPSLIMPQKIVLFGGKLMGYWAEICLKIFLSTKIEIKGKENIIQDSKFFIAGPDNFDMPCPTSKFSVSSNIRRSRGWNSDQ